MSQKFMNQTVETFGNVSDRALHMWNEEEKSSITPPLSTEEKNIEKKTIEIPKDFNYYFDNYMGNVHLQVLSYLFFSQSLTMN